MKPPTTSSAQLWTDLAQQRQILAAEPDEWTALSLISKQSLHKSVGSSVIDNRHQISEQYIGQPLKALILDCVCPTCVHIHHFNPNMYTTVAEQQQ